MKDKTTSISKLFTRYKLSSNEAEWVKLFMRSTGFDPMGTDKVTDTVSFLEMRQENISWFERWAEEQHTIISKPL